MLRFVLLVLPVLVPSWRFFQTVEASPRLEWQDRSGEWREFRPRPARAGLRQMLGRLFWNPVWNEGLYLVSLMERLEDAPTAHSQAGIERLLRQGLAPEAPAAFRVVFVMREGGGMVRHVAYRAPLDP